MGLISRWYQWVLYAHRLLLWTDQRPRACLSADSGPGPSPSGVSIGRLSGVGALWDCVSRRVCGGGGGCDGGGVPLGAGQCCLDVGRCLSGAGVNIIIIQTQSTESVLCVLCTVCGVWSRGFAPPRAGGTDRGHFAGAYRGGGGAAPRRPRRAGCGVLRLRGVFIRLPSFAIQLL